MTADELRATLEAELAWRQEELAFFKNLLNEIPEGNKDKYRKSLVLILYSHMEGYIKICLQTYIQYINGLSLARRNVNSGLRVAAMDREFKAYDNTDRKCEVFRRHLPEDTQLHRFFRRVDFVEQMDAIQSEAVSIDDNIIDTESNLWHIVLKKNLYKIGLPFDAFESYGNDMDALVNRRNSIAHGNSRSGVSQQEFEKWEVKVSSLLNGVTRIIYDYANNKRYLITSD